MSSYSHVIRRYYIYIYSLFICDKPLPATFLLKTSPTAIFNLLVFAVTFKMHFAILILLLVPGHVAEVQPEPEAGCLLQSAQGQLLALEAAQTNPTAASPLVAFVLWKLDPKHSMSTFYSARLTVLGSRPSTRPSSTRHTTQVSLATRRCALAAGPARNCGGRGKTDKIRTS